MPLNQPTRKFKAAIKNMAQSLCSAPIAVTGTIINAIDMAASISPRGKNTRALLRSLTLPIRNLERA